MTIQQSLTKLRAKHEKFIRVRARRFTSLETFVRNFYQYENDETLLKYPSLEEILKSLEKYELK